MLTLVHKKKGPGDEGDQIFDPLIFQACESNFRYPFGIVNT